jgi:hypothetical protein
MKKILLLAICVTLSGPAIAGKCPSGYTSVDTFCLPPGATYCGHGHACFNGVACGPNNTCQALGGNGPACGPPPEPGHDPHRCQNANQACAPNGLDCYDPSTTYFCGSAQCNKALNYPANSACGACSPHREQLKDAVADKPKPTVLSHYMRGIDEVPATHVGNDWVCPGGFPLEVNDNDHGHLCRPAGTKHCPFKARSYACLPGYSCNNTAYIGKSQEECRK